jgi:hypothetical protein
VVQAQDSQETVQGSQTLPASYPLSDVEIVLSRSGCFGTCPAYEVKVFGDGRVIYQGQDFVQVKGEQQAVIDKSEVLRLLERIYQVYFFDMKDYYDSRPSVFERDGEVQTGGLRMTDVPHQSVTVRLGTYVKTVNHSVGGPPDLRQLFDFIDEVAGTKRWIE